MTLIMRLIYSFILPFILTFYCYQNSYASHIVGGDISYECLGINPATGNNRYKILMHVYRDYINANAGAPFDNPAYIGIYTGNNTTSIYQNLPLSNPLISRIPINIGNPCWIVPSNIGVEEAIYEGVVELPYEASGYSISYQRCCRNNTVNNLSNSANEGATYTIFLTGLAQQECNSSPLFEQFPPLIICLNKDFSFDHSATDSDGHTLVYDFCSPFHGGGQGGGTGFSSPMPIPPAPPPYLPVQFGLGFSASNPISSNPNFQINPNTGLLTGFPTTTGQYVVGICVKEYDSSGNLLSTTLRDFQFNIVPCDDRINAKIAADSFDSTTDNYYLLSCGDSIVTFKNTSTVQSFITGYEWRIDLGNSAIFTSAAFEPILTFPGVGTYTGWLIANPGSTGCTDTAFLTISISLGVLADFEMSYDTCEIGLVSFQNQTSFTAANPISSYFWSFGNGASATSANPNYQYNYPIDTGINIIRLTAKDLQGCTSTQSKILDWTPKPIFPLTLENTISCVPVDASSFQSNHYPIPGYQFTWDFGDGTSSNQTLEDHTYYYSGTYNRSLTIRSPAGCEQSFGSQHIALDTPIARFSYLPNSLNSFNPKVNFIDESDLASYWEWNFGNGVQYISSFSGDAEYNYPDTGQQLVQLIVHHQNGCTDTASQILDIVPKHSFFLPNAFTPNSDGVNDVYKGKGNLQYIKSFDMLIYNRWGELVFESSNPTEAWNGRKNNIGPNCQAGVYIVLVKIEDSRGNKEEIKGFASLIL